MADTILVTGGTGFLGGWCIRQLLCEGRAVNATIRSGKGAAELRGALTEAGAPIEKLQVFEADLGADEGWDKAFSGVRYALHIASPTSMSFPKDEARLLEMTRGGTVRVLRAARDAGAERVVVTSSTYAAAYPKGGRTGEVHTEADWTDTEGSEITPYVRAKTLAERAAWEFAETEWEKRRLATICPAGIIGPLISHNVPDSMQLVRRMLQGKIPRLPRIALPFVDVRDCADLHCRALFDGAAGGERFIASGPILWMSELALRMRNELGASAEKVTTKEMPNWLVRVAALFDPNTRLILPELGVRRSFSSEKAEAMLGWHRRPLGESLRHGVESLSKLSLLG